MLIPDPPADAVEALARWFHDGLELTAKEGCYSCHLGGDMMLLLVSGKPERLDLLPPALAKIMADGKVTVIQVDDEVLN